MWSETGNSGVGRVGRVGEPVAHGDNALNVPRAVDDVAADDGGFRRALDGDDAVLDGNGEFVRVAAERAKDEILGDLALYLRVGPAVHAEHVGAGHDADQPSVVIGDREPLDPAGVHQARRSGDRLVGADGHRRLGHQVGRGHRGDPGLLAGPPHGVEHVGDGTLERFLGQQVGF
jgi:hypothetical protein